jgi:hypothetical protein
MCSIYKAFIIFFISVDTKSDISVCFLCAIKSKLFNDPTSTSRTYLTESAGPVIQPNQIAARDATCSIRFSQTRFPRASSNQSCAREACGMGTRGGGGSASRVGDWDVDFSDHWDWSSIPRLLSSACLFFCSGWVRFPPASAVVLPRNSLKGRGRLALLQVNRLLVAGTLLLMGAYP